MFIRLLLKYRNRSLALVAVLGVLSLLQGRNLTFDRSIENMFTSDDQTLQPYQKLKRTFGGNEIVIAVYDDPQLFDPSGVGIERCRSIQKRLAAVDGVKAVLSIDQPLPGNAIIQKNVIAQRTRRLFQGYTHGVDQRTVAIVCMLFPKSETNVPRRQTIDRLRREINEMPPDLLPGHLTGEPVLVVDGFRYVESDGRQLAKWSAILLGATIILCFRSLRWVIIPVAVVQLSLVLTNGTLAACGMKLSMVSSMLMAVVMVIAVATMVHVIVRFCEARSMGLSANEGIVRTFQIVGVPVFWACTTDAVGFLALTISDVGPVRDFGIMMAIGAGTVLLSVFLIVPGLALLGTADVDPREPWGQNELNRRLRESIGVIQRHPRLIVFSILALTGLAILGMSQTRVETDFTKNFRQDSQIVRAYEIVERKLGGAGVCDIIIPAPDKLDWKFLERVNALTKDVDLALAEHRTAHDMRAATKTLSLGDAVATLANMEDKPKFLRGGIATSTLYAMRSLMPEFFDALYGIDKQDDGKSFMRIMLRIPEQQASARKQQIINRIRETSESHFPEAQVTGYFVLLSNLLESVLRDQWRTFTAALLGIGFVMWIAFRSWRLALIALIPNSLPIMAVVGTMGWLRLFWFPDLKINIGVAMIAAVSMGLSIDSSIHYIISFQRARKEKTFRESLEQVQQNVGRAMVLSTLSLVVGFTVLATSEFVPTIYFGSLVSLAMLGGLLGNLIILPALLELFFRPRNECN